VPTVQDHPFPRLRDAGLTVTLNSDDPGMFASPLCGEYELARTVFDLNDDADKAALEADIDAWTENHAQ
jgi:adenosine deaminase